jgi:flagellar biosynthesis chaperone FliJ
MGRRRPPSTSDHLHLIAFVVYQTFKLNDTLIDTLLNAVQAAVNAAQKEHKETYYQEREQRNQSFTTLADRLGQSIQATLTAIKRIVTDKQLSDGEKVALIDSALAAQDGKPSPVERQIDEFKRKWTTVYQGRDYYALLEERSLKLQHRVADIVRQVQFAPNCSRPALREALLHYQNQAGTIGKSAPLVFLSAEQRAAVMDSDGKIRVSLYKALLFVEVADAIKSGALNLVHSEKYRSLDEYLIPKADWEANRGEYLQRAQLEGFADCRETLEAV